MKRSPEQTRDLILINMVASMPPQQWPLYALILGIQLTQAEPRLAQAILEATIVSEGCKESEVAVGAGIERAIAELRDGTEL